jgi:hypothetical protein
MQEPYRLDVIDSPDGRFVELGVRPLQRQAAASHKVDPSTTWRTDQQTSRQCDFAENVILAPKDVVHTCTVNMAFDDKARGQVKGHPSSENRRVPLLRVGVADGGAANLTEDHRPAILR